MAKSKLEWQSRGGLAIQRDELYVWLGRENVEYAEKLVAKQRDGVLRRVAKQRN